MNIINDHSEYTDHFSNVTSAKPSALPTLTPSTPNRIAKVTGGGERQSGGGAIQLRSGSGMSGGGGHHGHHRNRVGGGYGNGYGYPVGIGYDYPVYPEPLIVEAPPVPSEAKKEDTTAKATPIDMMGIVPYVVTGGIGAVAGYFIAKTQGKNSWYGAGIGAVIIVAGMFVFNQSQKK